MRKIVRCILLPARTKKRQTHSGLGVRKELNFVLRINGREISQNAPVKFFEIGKLLIN